MIEKLGPKIISEITAGEKGLSSAASGVANVFHTNIPKELLNHEVVTSNLTKCFKKIGGLFKSTFNEEEVSIITKSITSPDQIIFKYQLAESCSKIKGFDGRSIALLTKSAKSEEQAVLKIKFIEDQISQGKLNKDKVINTAIFIENQHQVDLVHNASGLIKEPNADLCSLISGVKTAEHSDLKLNSLRDLSKTKFKDEDKLYLLGKISTKEQAELLKKMIDKNLSQRDIDAILQYAKTPEDIKFIGENLNDNDAFTLISLVKKDVKYDIRD